MVDAARLCCGLAHALARRAEGGGAALSIGGDNLLVVDVVNAHGLVILQTIWAPKDHLRYGRRQTRSETIRDQAHLSARLAELVPLICSASAPPAAAAHTEGSATAVADPGPAHPAAGDLAAAA